jgi:hypothetical protein
MKRAVAGLVLGMWVQTAGADVKSFTTGNELLEYCRAEVGSLGWHTCLGYIMGASDMHDSLLAIRDMEPLFCTPTGVTFFQKVAVVVKYLEEHPESLYQAATAHVVDALLPAFPPRVADWKYTCEGIQ